ncbi:MAG: antitoxin [Desulfobacteraceae bacterium 4572_88]|nr:MAG: antitoxin [Desulfobacteraceae bacterium 4572_88]
MTRSLRGKILKSADTILYRFKPVREMKDFTDSPAGMEKLDSICMQLIATVESLKNLDKITTGSLLSAYPEVNWKGAKAMRDIIGHHYFEIDAEVIFDVCENKMKALRETVLTMLADMKKR